MESPQLHPESIMHLDYFMEQQLHGDKITLQLTTPRTPKHKMNSLYQSFASAQQAHEAENSSEDLNKKEFILENILPTLDLQHPKQDVLQTILHSGHTL